TAFAPGGPHADGTLSAVGRYGDGHALVGRVAQAPEHAARPQIPHPDRPRTDLPRPGREPTAREAAIAASGDEERTVGSKCHRIHLLEIAGRLPLRFPCRRVGAPYRVIVTASDNRSRVGGEGDGGDRGVVARHDPGGLLHREVVEFQVLSDAAGQRFPVRGEGHREQWALVPHGPPERAGGRAPLRLRGGTLPQPPFTHFLVFDARSEPVVPAVEAPVAAPAGDRFAVRREGDRADAIAVAGEGLLELAGGGVPELDQLVAAAAGQRGTVGREGERRDPDRLVLQLVAELAGGEVPDQDLLVRPCGGEQFAVGGEGDGVCFPLRVTRQRPDGLTRFHVAA